MGFTFKPDTDVALSRRLKTALAEFISKRVAVVSSAYWSIFVSSFAMVTPLIAAFSLTAIAKVSTAVTNRYGESGLPCLTPCSRKKWSEINPSFIMQLCMF